MAGLRAGYCFGEQLVEVFADLTAFRFVAPIFGTGAVGSSPCQRVKLFKQIVARAKKKHSKPICGLLDSFFGMTAFVALSHWLGGWFTN